ncbi:MAG: hypothetical protein ACD_21C00250G0041 [uncultured bacterium]|nr:MAG: hypothetical protein ACD_21C00250G0041 [uncultured bacterium]
MEKLIKNILTLFLKQFPVSKKPVFFRFGYNPTGYLKEDFITCFFGTRNLYKHYQVSKIIEALDITSSDAILDFGCGSGYISVEMAKLAKFVLAVDISPTTEKNPIPDFLNSQIRFLRIEDENDLIPNYQGFFDKILLSEVLLSVPSTDSLLKLCKKLLKPNGTIVVVNGLGKFFIKKSIYTRPWFLRFLEKIFKNIPKSYELYEKGLCKDFGNTSTQLLKREDILKLLSKHERFLYKEMYAPKKWIASTIEVHQFLKHISQIEPNYSFPVFLLYRLFFCFINVFQKTSCSSGFIGVFKKK